MLIVSLYPPPPPPRARVRSHLPGQINELMNAWPWRNSAQLHIMPLRKVSLEACWWFWWQDGEAFLTFGETLKALHASAALRALLTYIGYTVHEARLHVHLTSP